jgi:excisionase family DNA binding protein
MARKTTDHSGQREALFVRIPTEQASGLDRAAFELKLSKQDLVTALLARYVDPASPASLAALRDLGASDARRVVVETSGEELTVGRHAFMPDPAPEVLTLEQAAALLHADVDAVAALAESGELPARRIGQAWRFYRQAILDWLAGGHA